MQAAQGLAAAHAQGLVHRDVKPANILLENGVQRVLLTDFGLARAIDDVSLTCSGTIAGTPQYMSPEQSRGEAVDHRTDLFSLGSVLYAMCAGRPPFRAETTMGVLRRICDDPPRDLREVNADVPGWLVAIIHKLLAKSRTARFQSADEVARLLERCLAHLQHPTAVPLPDAVKALVSPRRAARFATRWVLPSALAGMVGTALCCWVLWDRGHERELSPNVDRGQVPAVHASGTGTAAPQVSHDIPRWNDGMEKKLTEIETDLQTRERFEHQAW